MHLWLISPSFPITAILVPPLGGRRHKYLSNYGQRWKKRWPFPAGGNRLFHSLGLLSCSVVTSVLWAAWWWWWQRQRWRRRASPPTADRMKRQRLPDERLPIEALAESAMQQCDPLRNMCLWCWSKSPITGLGGRRWRLLMWSPSSSAVT